MADSLNPTTIAPALYLATGERARNRVAEFTAAVFAVYFLGGAAIGVGAGQLIRPLLPHPHHHITDIVEIAVGVAMIAGAALLWRYRTTLSRRDPPDFDPAGQVELGPRRVDHRGRAADRVPVLRGDRGDRRLGARPGARSRAAVLFNICFVLPLLGIVGVLTFAGERADQMLVAGRDFLQRHWPAVLAGLALVAGVFVVALGVTGLAASHSAPVRRIHKTLRAGSAPATPARRHGARRHL